MSKRVYISADYSENDGDRNVVDVLHAWGKDDKHKVDYVDTAQVVSGSVSNDSDCRACDLKREFNRQINASSAVIFIIGDKTATRTAGSSCKRNTDGAYCSCTPYKQNTNGAATCKCVSTSTPGPDDDVGYINALNKWSDWLPAYMSDYKDQAQPFWVKNEYGDKVGNYAFIKKALGYV